MFCSWNTAWYWSPNPLHAITTGNIVMVMEQYIWFCHSIVILQVNSRMYSTTSMCRPMQKMVFSGETGCCALWRMKRDRSEKRPETQSWKIQYVAAVRGETCYRCCVWAQLQHSLTLSSFTRAHLWPPTSAEHCQCVFWNNSKMHLKVVFNRRACSGLHHLWHRVYTTRVLFYWILYLSADCIWCYTCILHSCIFRSQVGRK